MQFGLYLPNQAGFADPRVLASLARDAEHAGWDGIFMWDELFPIYDYAIGREKTAADDDVDWHAVADPIVAMTAIAAATERIRFGALVTPVARLRPEAFAQQTATLDRFSGGRLILGVGLGNPDTQFVAFGHEGDVRIRAAQVDEFLALLVELWAGRAVDFDGVHFRARGVTLTPAPLQSPRIPNLDRSRLGEPRATAAGCAVGRVRAGQPRVAPRCHQRCAVPRDRRRHPLRTDLRDAVRRGSDRKCRRVRSLDKRPGRVRGSRCDMAARPGTDRQRGHRARPAWPANAFTMTPCSTDHAFDVRPDTAPERRTEARPRCLIECPPRRGG